MARVSHRGRHEALLDALAPDTAVELRVDLLAAMLMPAAAHYVLRVTRLARRACLGARGRGRVDFAQASEVLAADFGLNGHDFEIPARTMLETTRRPR